MTFPVKIISGGQTGADRAGLDVAIKLGLAHGGTVPRGRRSEDGGVPAQYQMVEHTSADYPPRTKCNVEDADASIIFLPKFRASRGSRLTVSYAAASLKPYLVITFDRTMGINQAAVPLAHFLKEHNPQTLNIAGPRESTTPGVHDFVYEVLIAAYNIMKHEQES